MRLSSANIPHHGFSLFFCVPLLSAGTVFAQQTATDIAEENTGGDIVVTAQRLRGSVATTVPPLEEIDAADIEALGASSITEVLAAVAPQSNSGRGRGGRPIILVNGQRLSSRRELRDLPPEAIRQVQIFPEEVALQYGFRPDQRVINFILKDNFAGASVEIEYGQPENGGYGQQEYDFDFTRIGKSHRLNINLEYLNRGTLTEDERDIAVEADALFARSGNVTAPDGGEIDPALSALAGAPITAIGIPSTPNPALADFAANPVLASDNNNGAFRTITGARDRFEANVTFSKTLAPQTSLSLNANYLLDEVQSLLGLPSASLSLPASNPFSPFAQDVIINQSFTSPRALGRDNVTNELNLGSSFNSLIGDWRWSLTADYNYIDVEQTTNRNADFEALQAGLNDGSINPFADDFGDNLRFLAPDLSDSNNQLLSIRNNISGALFEIPSGPVRMTFGQNYTQQWLDTRSLVSGAESFSNLARRNVAATANIEIPLIDRDFGALGFLGKLAINGNYGIADLSDFGVLNEYGFGVIWSPANSLNLQATYSSDEEAPGIASVGAATIVTPNSNFFDIARNETVFIDLISGGNPALRAERRRDIKLSLSWKPYFLNGATIQTEYFRNRSENITSAFPLLTPEIEAAFPDRVIRAVTGELLSVDRRPVTYDDFKSKSLRSGITIRGALGSQRRGRPPRPDAAGRGQRPRGNARRSIPQRPSRFFLSLFHTYRFQEEILIRPGLAILDRLNGSSTDFLGGTPKHEIELSGGLFHKGMGLRVTGDYRSATKVNGTGLVDSTDLNFSDRISLNLRFWIGFDQRGNLTQKIPALKGSRIRFRVVNPFNDYVRVTDSNGDVPLNYQRGLTDPRGRFFEVNFRKRF